MKKPYPSVLTVAAVCVVTIEFSALLEIGIILRRISIKRTVPAPIDRFVSSYIMSGYGKIFTG